MMRKFRFGIFVFLLLGLCGCKKEEQIIELLPASRELFSYEKIETAEAFAVDDSGRLYTTLYCPAYQEGEVHVESEKKASMQQIRVYDLEGNCVEQVELELCDGMVYAMFAVGETLYLAGNESGLDGFYPVVYSVDTNTWEVTKRKELKELTRVENMVLIDQYLYILGISSAPEVKNYTLAPDVIAYNYFGEVVGRVDLSITEDDMVLFNVDFPVDIFGTTDNTLGIYQYTEENGFGFLEYSPAEGTLTETGNRQDVLSARCFTGCEEGCIFTTDTYLYYGTLDGGQTQITSERVEIYSTPVYKKGFVFYENNYSGKIERLCTGSLMKKNEEIHLLMHNDIMDKPYGCGYQIENLMLESEQFALKVLAQDKDFDLYQLSSRNPASYNLKENGAFYPLNEVEGVQEYLDVCFPYIKDAAMNEEGEIWMLPIALSIPGLVYNKEFCADSGINFANMDFKEFLSFTQETERTQPEAASISTYVVMEELFGRYLKSYESFDTELFREYSVKAREIYEEQGSWTLDMILGNTLNVGIIPELYFEYEMFMYDYFNCARWLGDSDAVGLTGVPGITENDGNVGTITFFAVNPQSENLETTLEYISAFAKYMMKKKDSFMLADIEMYTDTPFIREWYELYAGGSVTFAMDREVYWNTFNSYLRGEMELEIMIEEIERCRKMYTEE